MFFFAADGDFSEEKYKVNWVSSWVQQETVAFNWKESTYAQTYVVRSHLLMLLHQLSIAHMQSSWAVSLNQVACDLCGYLIVRRGMRQFVFPLPGVRVCNLKAVSRQETQHCLDHMGLPQQR